MLWIPYWLPDMNRETSLREIDYHLDGRVENTPR